MKKKKDNEFLRGYLTAVCALIRMDGIVSTQAAELFNGGVGNMSIYDLRKQVVDESDIETIEKHYEELNILPF